MNLYNGKFHAMLYEKGLSMRLAILSDKEYSGDKTINDKRNYLYA
jgi:hypothetical protein